MADLEGKVNELLIHMQYVREKIDAIEHERELSSKTFWGKIDEIKNDISSLKTETSTMKVKIGAVVVVVSTVITGALNWAFRHVK